MTGALSLALFDKTLRFPLTRSKIHKLGDLLNMQQVDIPQVSRQVKSRGSRYFLGRVYECETPKAIRIMGL